MMDPKLRLLLQQNNFGLSHGKMMEADIKKIDNNIQLFYLFSK